MRLRREGQRQKGGAAAGVRPLPARLPPDLLGTPAACGAPGGGTLHCHIRHVLLPPAMHMLVHRHASRCMSGAPHSCRADMCVCCPAARLCKGAGLGTMHTK